MEKTLAMALRAGAIGICLVAAAAAADERQAANKGVVSHLDVHRVTLKDGKPILDGADAIRPGDELDYAATYTNLTAAAVDRLSATVPIPAGTVLVPGSDTPPASEASLDGRTFAPLPLARMVTRADGTRVSEPVPTTEYRALRWRVGALPAGQAVTVHLHAKIESLPALASTNP